MDWPAIFLQRLLGRLGKPNPLLFGQYFRNTDKLAYFHLFENSNETSWSIAHESWVLTSPQYSAEQAANLFLVMMDGREVNGSGMPYGGPQRAYQGQASGGASQNAGAPGNQPGPNVSGSGSSSANGMMYGGPSGGQNVMVGGGAPAPSPRHGKVINAAEQVWMQIGTNHSLNQLQCELIVLDSINSESHGRRGSRAKCLGAYPSTQSLQLPSSS